MPFFKESKDMYEIFQALFDRMSTHQELGPALADSGLIVRFKLHEPDGKLTLNCREEPPEEGKYISYSLGESSLEPDFTLSTSADFCHRFWLGKVDVVASLFSGKAKAEGDISKAMKFMPVLKKINQIYSQMLNELGREDLIVE